MFDKENRIYIESMDLSLQEKILQAFSSGNDICCNQDVADWN